MLSKILCTTVILIIIAIIILYLTRQTIPSQIDFAQLKASTRPNWYLVCPADLCPQAQAQSPVLNVSLTQLKQGWQQVIAAEYRITMLASNAEQTQMTYVQRSPVMHFPDIINVKLIDLDDHHSTIAIYSAAIYGYSDNGVNQRRITLWLQRLQENLAT